MTSDQQLEKKREKKMAFNISPQINQDTLGPTSCVPPLLQASPWAPRTPPTFNPTTSPAPPCVYVCLYMVGVCSPQARYWPVHPTYPLVPNRPPRPCQCPTDFWERQYPSRYESWCFSQAGDRVVGWGPILFQLSPREPGGCWELWFLPTTILSSLSFRSNLSPGQ